MTAPAPISARLGAVQLLVMDVDGVLTDGGIYYTERGDELKRFDVRDGQGLVLLRQAGVLTAVITRRRSEIVERRADELGIVEVHQGATDKRAVLETLLGRRGLSASHVAYVGDDVGDIPAMRLVGVPIAVADAVPAVKQAAVYVTRAHPGRGAIREVCDLILGAARRRPGPPPARARMPAAPLSRRAPARSRRGRGRSSP